MKKAVFYGDSNTYGYDPRNFIPGRYPEDVRWPDRLSDDFWGKWVIEADGMNGRKIPEVRRSGGPVSDGAGGSDRMQEENRLLWESLICHLPADLFCVMLGSNDILGSSRPAEEKAAAKAAIHMRRFVRFLKELSRMQEHETGSGFHILLTAPPQPFGGEGSKSGASADERKEQYRREAAEMNILFGKLASEEDILFCDAGRWGIETAFDGIHFSEKGHIIFSKKMGEVLAGIG